MNWEQSQNECLKNWGRVSRNGQMWRGGISVKGKAFWQKFYFRNKNSGKLKQNVREKRRMNWTNRVHSRSKDEDSNYSWSLWAEGVRLVNRGTLVRFRFGSPFSWKLSCDHALTINETLKWLSSLPILTQEWFWWWQSSVRYSLPLPPPPGISAPTCTFSETASVTKNKSFTRMPGELKTQNFYYARIQNLGSCLLLQSVMQISYNYIKQQ